jgi:hypothetical protein
MVTQNKKKQQYFWKKRFVVSSRSTFGGDSNLQVNENLYSF